MNFFELHHQSDPLIVCNVWDARSATIAEELGFQAIGTSSAAISAMLGYPDGETMSFSELYAVVERIQSATTLPLTVDIEAGYSRQADEIAQHIKQLVDLGVAGINIEDSVVSQQRELLNSKVFTQLLANVKELLDKEGVNVFINVRTDVYLVGSDNPVEETVKRAQQYEQCGADGLFVPCIENADDIHRVTQCCGVPINVMCMPNLPDFCQLKKLGVKRISMGNSVFEHMYTHLGHTLVSIQVQQSFSTIV